MDGLSPEGVQRQDPCPIQCRGNMVIPGFGGVILGLSLSNVLPGKLPLLGVQGRRLSSKSVCH